MRGGTPRSTTFFDLIRKENNIMKAYLQKLIGTAALGLALFSTSIPAWAGEAYVEEVRVSDLDARGSTAGARYSGDSQQYIGCSFSNNGGPFVVCSAKDKTGKAVACTGTDPGLAAAAKAITDFSYISFSSAQARAGAL